MARLLWTLKQHVGPAPRSLHAAAFDVRRSRVVIFGGTSLAGTTFSDTWEWDGENWTQLDDIGPNPRFSATLAYDAARDRSVLFGGVGAGGELGDTWEWNGEDWTQLANSGPPARSGHAAVFDSVRNRVVMFGGESSGALLADTWEWDGNEWVQVEDVGPTPRRSHTMTFDAVRSRVVLFGGTTQAATLGDTWEYDGTAWTQTAGFGPPPCLSASLIFNGRRALLFGGVSSLTGTATLFHLTWEWDGRHWTVRQDLGPSARSGHTMVFDARRNRGVLFGGTPSLPTVLPAVASGETWEQFEQGAAAGAPLPPPTSPPLPPAPTVDVQVVSVAITPAQPVEGEPAAIVATLSAAPAAGTNVSFTIRDAGGNDIIGSLLLAPANGTTARVDAFVAPAGQYTVTASLGSSNQGAPLTILRSPVALQSLGANPPTASAGAPFTLRAVISSPVLGPRSLPLLVGIQGGPQTLWMGPALQIATGQSQGTVTIDPQMFGGGVVGALTFTGSLGGSTASATVTLS